MHRRDVLCLAGASVSGLVAPSLFRSGSPAAGRNGRNLPDAFDLMLSGFRAPKAHPHAPTETIRH